MFRNTDRFSRGNRPYQICLVILLFAFGCYVLHTQNKMVDMQLTIEKCAAPSWNSSGFGNMKTMETSTNTDKPECVCNCKCEPCPSSNQALSTNNALPPPKRDNEDNKNEGGAGKQVGLVNDHALIAIHPSSRQDYTSQPSIQSAADLAKNPQWDKDQNPYMQFVRAAYPPVGPELGSIIDPRYLNTPIAYGTPSVPRNPSASDSFADLSMNPPEFIMRPACQHDTDLLQNYIYKNQHPENCKTKKLFVRRHMPGYGLFAGLGLSSNYLFLAAILQRTLIDLSPNTYFTGNCKSNGLDCAFLPISSCGPEDFQESEICYDNHCFDNSRVISIDHMQLTDFLPCAPTEYPKERCRQNGGPSITHTLNELLPDLSPHGEQFFQAEFSRYLTRPNARLQEYTAQQMKELGLTNQIIGVHVRHGDKQEGIQFPTQAYSLIVRRVIQITGIKTVFIGSDDKSVYEELPKWVDLGGITYKWMDPNLNPIVFSAAEAGRKGEHTIGLNLMAQTIIFTQAAAYIGTRTSNAGQIVYAMQGNDCSNQKIAYDMYGDLFYNSWYCRGDIVHAGREWMCALKRPEPNQGLIWRWGDAKTEC